MAYRVDISLPALADAEEAYLWIKYHSPETAGGWYEGLLQAVFSLEEFPLRCPLARKARTLDRRSGSFYMEKVTDPIEYSSASNWMKQPVKMSSAFFAFGIHRGEARRLMKLEKDRSK